MPERMSAEGLKAAADATKQVITLSTGVIALTVTFLEKIIEPTTTAGSRAVPWPMFAAWIFYVLAIVAGVATLGAISGTLDAIDRKLNGLSTSPNQDEAVALLVCGKNVQNPARVMGVSFLLAMAFTVATGFSRH